MAKVDALAKADELLAQGSHAKLNARPGTQIMHELEELRALIDGIVEA